MTEIKHYGVLGMRWGHRKASSAAETIRRESANLRKHGYSKEADALDIEANKQQGKADALKKKLDDAKREREMKRLKIGTLFLGRKPGESLEAFEARVDKDNATFDDLAGKMEAARKEAKAAKDRAKKDSKNLGLQEEAFRAEKKLKEAEQNFDQHVWGDKPKKESRDVRNMSPIEREKHYAILRDKDIPQSERWAEATFREKVNWSVGLGDPAISNGKKAALVLLGTAGSLAIQYIIR